VIKGQDVVVSARTEKNYKELCMRPAIMCPA
jgi:hypothetical protein